MSVQVDAATSPRTITQTSGRDRDRTFFTAAAIANALIIVSGFAYSTYARIQLGDLRFGGPTLTTMVRLHAAVSATWVVLLIVQARLIAASRVRLHRRLGIFGGLIAAAVVVVGWIVAVAAVRRGVGAGGSESIAALRFFALPVQELVVFTILISAALWLRKRGAYHKRLILIGTLALIPAATTRPFSPESLPATLAMFGLPEAMFLLALSFHDRRSLGRLHTATLWGGGLLLTSAFSRTWVAETGVWLACADAVIR